MKEMPITMGNQKKNIDNINEQTFCVFCLNVLNERNFTVVDETIKGILDILFLTPSVEVTNTAIMCDDCSVKLFAAFDFKTKCVETEDCIFPYVNPEKEVDLREVYLNEMGKEQQQNLSEDDKICRLCMQIVTFGFKPIKEDTFSGYIPEVNFSSTKEPVVCRVCLDLLDTHTKFLKNCLEMKERIKDIYEDKNSKSVCSIKHEEIEIKSEENVDSETHNLHSESIDTPKETIPEATRRTTKSKLENYSCGGCKYCPAVEKPPEPKPKKKKKATTYKCAQCDFKTEKNNLFKRHMWRRHAYKCDTCSYTTGTKRSLNDHIAIHKEKWKCDSCDFDTHLRKSLTQHAKRHETPGDVPTYECEYSDCDFKTMYKKRIQRHLSTHQSKIWKCDFCDFQTHYKLGLTKHAKRHKTPSNVPTYKCVYSTCDFKTVHKNSFQRHMLTHQPRTRKCDLCDFHAHRQKDLNKHFKTHKMPWELPTHKCDYLDCEFKTIYKQVMRSHLSTHKKGEASALSCASGDIKMSE